MVPSRILLAVLLSSVLPLASCYSTGAPPSTEICTSLKPNHPAEPKKEPFPYKLTVDKNVVAPGNTVTLKISGTTKPYDVFKGFLIQGRRAGTLGGTTTFGTFMTDKNTEVLQGLDCSGQDNNAVTHRSGEPKTSVEVVWKAPKQPGTYVLLTTVVHSAKIFWVKQASPTITVK